jgi:molybdopterin converting factor small subunit
MNITVEYTAHLKQAAGVGSEEIEIQPGCTPRQLARQLAERHGETLGRLILDESGGLNPSVLLFAGGVQVRDDEPMPLRDRDTVTFLAPISGG